MKGNLIDFAEQGVFNVIIHGCNCFHVMGAGIAKEIKCRYPKAYEADITHTIKGDETKLGHYSYALIETVDRPFTIINGYTQYAYGKGGPHINYKAIQSVFRRVAKQYFTSVIGYPYIGAGLGGGDWSIIQKIINEELKNISHHLVTFK